MTGLLGRDSDACFYCVVYNGDVSRRHFVFVNLDLFRCTSGGTLLPLPSPPVKDKVEGGINLWNL